MDKIIVEQKISFEEAVKIANAQGYAVMMVVADGNKTIIYVV